jgi:hypothetical protein
VRAALGGMSDVCRAVVANSRRCMPDVIPVRGTLLLCVSSCELTVVRLVAGCVAGRWLSCRWHTAQETRNVSRYFDITARLPSRTADVVPLTMQALTVADCQFTLQDVHFGQSQGFVLERPDRPRDSPSPPLNG